MEVEPHVAPEAVACPDALVAWAVARPRALPWREHAGPWAVLLSEVMLQQTTVSTVTRRFPALLARWPTPAAMAASPADEVVGAWAGLGYYARARRLHAAAAAMVQRHGGLVPDDLDALAALPGLGRYTAAAVAALAFGRPVVPVDTNVARIAARLWALEVTGTRLLDEAAARLRPGDRPAAVVSALMDLGQTVCRPRAPDCAACPWARGCAARASGRPQAWPRPVARRPRADWRGRAYVLLAEGELGLIRRPPGGLLGGTLGLPGPAPAAGQPPPAWPGAVRAGPDMVHLFTHVRLTLEVLRLEVADRAGARALAGAPLVWRPLRQAGADLPTLDRRALALAGLPTAAHVGMAA